MVNQPDIHELRRHLDLDHKIIAPVGSYTQLAAFHDRDHRTRPISHDHAQH